MNLYVIRHGEVNINVRNEVNSINDSILTEKGINQVEAAADKLENYNIDLIICSPISRTRETCAHVNRKNIKVEYDDRLIERDGKSMQFCSADIIDWDIWYDASKDIIYKDTEGFGSVRKRISEFLNEITRKYEDKNILLVTHGDVCKAIYTVINNIKSVKETLKFDQQNAEVVEYEIKKGKAKLKI